jgi:anti-sigma factor RsiW
MRATGDAAPLVGEAVTDHLRVLTSQNPLEIRSGGIHQVKPWFEGRLDFAPVVRFAGDDEFPLQGGSVGYFLDRKAAVFVFKRRLHVVTLLVFPAQGMPWPTRGLTALGDARAYAAASRGFNVLLWREGDQGYALVSDVDTPELTRLALRLAGGA